MSRRDQSVERKLRDQASVATQERIHQDREKVSRTLRPLLRPLAARFLDADFDVNALRLEHGIRRRSGWHQVWPCVGSMAQRVRHASSNSGEPDGASAAIPTGRRGDRR